LNEPGMPPARGFGGRVYFYNENSETIPVEGQLVVYGYDESISRDGKSQADRKFVFPAAKIAEHFAPTDMGASYSIWVPWGQPMDPATEVTLVSMLTTSSGSVVMDQGAKNNLPGAMSKRQKEITKSANPDALFSPTPEQENTNSPPADGRPKQLQTTTIPLSPKHIEHTAVREMPVANRVVPAAAYEPTPPLDRPSTNRSHAIVEGNDTRPQDVRPSKRERRSRSGGATGTLLGPSTID
jgi:hypothetical protein